MIEQLQLSYIQTTSAQAQSALSDDDVKAAQVSGQQTQSFIAKLKEIKAEGRIAIHLADLASFTNSEYDFTLKPGDALHIPEKPSFVSVVGSVYSPGSFLYQPNKKLKFYLAKSGGTAKTADEDYIYLLKANGEILSVSQDDGFFSKFENTILMP
jgi:protein involved in polysaccharide export with SLBB domain